MEAALLLLIIVNLIIKMLTGHLEKLLHAVINFMNSIQMAGLIMLHSLRVAPKFVTFRMTVNSISVMLVQEKIARKMQLNQEN